MKKIISLLIGLLMIWQLCPAVYAAGSVTLYVSPGAVGGNGSFEKPYGTIMEAKTAIRSISKTANTGITVYLRGGEYRLTSPVEMTNRDSGTATCPITYTNYNDEKVVVKGSVPLDTSKFTEITNQDASNRLDASVRDKVVQLDLSTAGVTRADYGELAYPGMYQTVGNPASTELFSDGEAMTLARYPNEGYIDIDNVVSVDTNSFTLGYGSEHSARMDRWVAAKDAKLYGFWMWNWADQTIDIASVDAANNTITTKQNSYYSVAEGENRRYYAYNLLEEIDIPGEYYIDRESNILYFYPTENYKENPMSLSVMRNALFVMTSVKYVNIKGLYMTENRNQAVRMVSSASGDCENCHVTDCTVTYTSAQNGSSAMLITGKNNGVENCNFENVDGGVEVRGGDKSTLTHGGNYVKNCRFNNFSTKKRTYNPAILIRGTGNTASNNLIENAPHNAIMFEGTEHTVEYNEISNVLTETTDAGAIYCGADVTARGNVVRYNYIHDIEDIFATSIDTTWCHGVYLDDNFCSADIYGNVFKNIAGYGVFIGGGRDNLISNNVFLNCTRGTVYIDQRGEWETGEGEGFTENGKFIKQLRDAAIDNDLWRTEYKEVFDMLAEFGNGTIEISYPKNNLVENNVYVLSGAEFYKPLALKYGTLKNNLTYSVNPGFVSDSDFNLTDEAQIKKDNSDFVAIPFLKIGYKPVVKDIIFAGTRYNKPGNSYHRDGATLDAATNSSFMEESYSLKLIEKLGAEEVERDLTTQELEYNLAWTFPEVLIKLNNSEAKSPTTEAEKVNLRYIHIQDDGNLYLSYNRREGAMVKNFKIGVSYVENGVAKFEKDFVFDVIMRRFEPSLTSGNITLNEGDSLKNGQWIPQIAVKNQDITFRGFYAAALYKKLADGSLVLRDITYNSSPMTLEKTNDIITFDKTLNVTNNDSDVIKFFAWSYSNNDKNANYKPLRDEIVFD